VARTNNQPASWRPDDDTALWTFSEQLDSAARLDEDTTGKHPPAFWSAIKLITLLSVCWIAFLGFVVLPLSLLIAHAVEVTGRI